MAKRKKKPDFDFEAYEREAEKRSAWAYYSKYIHIQNEQRDDYKLAYGSESEQQEIKTRRKNRTPLLRIN